MKNIIDENINKQLYDINIEKEIKKADEESMLFLQTELLTEICSHLLKIFKCQTE